jgi:plasmid maintenance system antidote protein VapI
MDIENLGNNKFAEIIGIAPTLISNIMSERNRATLDTITAILKAFPKINSDWLLFGTGIMYKSDTSKVEAIEKTDSLLYRAQQLPTSSIVAQDLFSQNPAKPDNPAGKSEYRKDNELNPSQNPVQSIVTERIIYKEQPEKKIMRIIVYYSDNTFEVFDTGKLVS